MVFEDHPPTLTVPYQYRLPKHRILFLTGKLFPRLIPAFDVCALCSDMEVTAWLFILGHLALERVLKRVPEVLLFHLLGLVYLV